ncbi:MAG TPA: nuclear transport factor 2 family protein [Ideonella sp.]|uniref:nuclear transport factor 2 family protein n=1 Tax=Ideonella sp. TaxID=1929293 RepID=UPI002C7B9628|nr:nuclear transport factor 2 family protein [Ideonella sp.]HSI51318.1 nuclear transport factor 2 family protein [Ideonella sp.]
MKLIQRSRRAALSALLTLAATLPLFTLPEAAMAQSDEARAVGAAVEKLRTLMVDPDRAALEAIVADNLTYGHSGGKVDTKASFIKDLLEGNSDFVSISLTEQQVTVTGEVATVRHVLQAATNDAGKGPGTVKLHVLSVWTRQAGGAWTLLARQAVRLPT